MGISKCDAVFPTSSELDFWNAVLNFKNYTPESIDNRLINGLGRHRHNKYSVKFGSIHNDEVGELLTEHGELTSHLMQRKILTTKLQQEMKKINSLMNMLPPANGTTLYRGVRSLANPILLSALSHSANKNITVVFKTTSFLSFTESPFIAKNYITNHTGIISDNSLLFVNEPPNNAARAISYYSPVPEEAEVLYPLNIYFKLINAVQLPLQHGVIWRIKIHEIEKIKEYNNVMVFDFWGNPFSLSGSI